MRKFVKSRCGKIISAICILFALTMLSSPLWFPMIGSFLVVSDPLEKADAIVVLGGGDPQRTVVAAKLHKDGWAQEVITTGSVIPNFAGADGEPVTFAEVSASQVSIEGVPPRFITQLRNGSSTFEEAGVLKTYAAEKKIDSMIIVTSIYHTRRARLVFRKVFDDNGVKIIMRPAEGGEFKLDKWWTREEDLVFVNNEYIKLIMYLFRGMI